MSSKLLREYISHILQEKGENLLKKWSGENDVVVNQLAEKGIIVIPRGAKDISTPIGSGEYSEVFEAMWKGKRVAVKVTPYDYEAETYRNVEKLRSQSPNIVARHIIKTYEIDTLSSYINDDNEVEDETFYMITEILVPTPKALQYEFWSGWMELSDVGEMERSILDRKKMYLDDTQHIKDIVEREFKSDLSVEEHQHIIDVIIDAIKEDLESTRHGYINAGWIRGLVAIKLSIHNPLSKEDRTLLTKVENVARVVNKSLRGEKFPADYTDNDKIVLSKKSQNPQIKSLIHALEYFKKKYDIKWEDLHVNNVMMRPSTGELVVSDVGFFH